MDVQDGITVRPMRLKVLYTFDNENKTNCLARWPHLLDIQTAYLDEKTQIGVIELKTCIQAIVSASPELVAKLGQDYTVYAYDYSEYETPLVGQGMLSWVLASASTTPNAPAHQSKTIVTGRVSKNVLGLFSKGAQETLEVKLRLVPVPTLMQSEYLESMQRYREISNVIPQDFDSQAWSSFIQQNPHMFARSQGSQSTDRLNGSIDHSGIEKFHQLLSEGSTPREFPSTHPDSAAPSPVNPPSRCDSPINIMPNIQQSRQQSVVGHRRRESDASIRPLSRASAHDGEFQLHDPETRRGSIHSGYGSGDETMDHPPRKRARLFRADVTGKDDMNIERQPGSLRVAASTAASVRIHRPTPINSSHPAVSSSALEEPIRPPTPISRASNEGLRRSRPAPSLLRESSTNSATTYKSPYATYDDVPSTDLPATSPDNQRYQGIFESQFTMPSSPPITDGGFPSRSSPVLPPLPIPPDSGFMSATLEDLMDEDGCLRTNLDENQDVVAMTDCDQADQNHRHTLTRRHTSPANNPSVSTRQKDNFLTSDGPYESNSSSKEASALPPRRGSTASRPSSRMSIRPVQKLAPAPISQSEIEHIINSIPASDPIIPPQGYLHHSASWSGPMSDMPSVETPRSHTGEEGGKTRSGAGARRVRQVQSRLESCIKEGQVPPYCNNCGAIETPTWRRAWSKDFDGSEQDANNSLKDPMFLFWTALERDDDKKITKFRLYKKTIVDTDKDFDQILLCNPCGLWLQKFKSMRPENRWNKQPAKDKRKRSARTRKGPLTGGASTRSRSKSQMNSMPSESSPAHTDSSSPEGDNGSQAGEDDDATLTVENGNENANDNDEFEQPNKRIRASSAEPTRSSDSLQNRWDENAAMEALKRAIQSSPARNLDAQTLKLNDENLTPKPVRRALFPNNHDGPLKTLGESLLNSPRRSPRVVSRGSEKAVADKENNPAATNHNLDDLFESPTFTLHNTPTPKRRTPRSNERRLSLPFCSPSTSKVKNSTVARSPNAARSGDARSMSEQGASLDGDAGDKNTFPSVVDMVQDNLFDPWQSLPQSDMYIPFSDWSPTGVNGNSMLQFPGGFNDDEALINAILSESELHQATEVNVAFPNGATATDATPENSAGNNANEAQPAVASN